MSILIDEKTPIIVQGFTGDKASFHADEMIKYGSNVVGGVTPGKGGIEHLSRPVFNTVKDAVNSTGATASLAFVPPSYAADALMEAADAGLRLVCIITDGIPSQVPSNIFQASGRFVELSLPSFNLTCRD